MSRTRRVALAVTATLFGACSSSSGKPRGSDDMPGETAVFQMLSSTAPPFLIAQSQAGKAVAFLSEKDELGNPLLVTGVAFVAGDDFLSIQTDELGRPTELATRTSMVKLSDYQEHTVHMASVRGPGEVTEQDVSYEADELASMLLPPPSLNATVYSTDDGLLHKLMHWGHDLSELYGCITTPVHLKHAPGGLFGQIMLGLVGELECTGLASLLPSSEFEAITDAVSAGAASVGCIGGIAGTVAGIVTGVGAWVPALRAIVDCPVAVEKVQNVISSALLRLRLRMGFVGECRGDLTEGKAGQVTLSLVARPGDDQLKDVSVNASALNAGVQPLSYDGQHWAATLEVVPPNAGLQEVIFLVPGVSAEAAPTKAVCRVQGDTLTATIHVSPTVVARGSSVMVDADVQGGTKPYHYLWDVRREGITEVQPQLSDAGASFVDIPTQRTRYVLDIYDDSFPIQQANAREVWVEVCGDGYCGSGEEDACGEDCADAGTDTQADAAVAHAGVDDASIPIDAAMPDVQPDTGAPLAGGSAAARCEAACTYRSNELGCGGDPNTCAAFCLAVHNVANQEGSCSTQSNALEDCRYSKPALELGCKVTDSDIDMRVCAAESAAVDACKVMRDAPKHACYGGHPNENLLAATRAWHS